MVGWPGFRNEKNAGAARAPAEYREVVRRNDLLVYMIIDLYGSFR
jgi:hypothetical protein